MLKFGTPTIALPLAIKKCTVQTGCTVYSYLHSWFPWNPWNLPKIMFFIVIYRCYGIFFGILQKKCLKNLLVGRPIEKIALLRGKEPPLLIKGLGVGYFLAS